MLMFILIMIINKNYMMMGKWTREKDFLEDLLICLCW